MLGLMLFLLLGLLVGWAACVVYTAWMLTHPPRRTYASAVARGRPGDPSELHPSRAFESWTLSSRGRSLPVWDIPGDRPDGPVVILTHGWGDSRIGTLARLPALVPHARRVIAWDLPGHGESPGICELGSAEWNDLHALVEEVRGQSRESRDLPIVLYGWSLGAGVSMALACNGSDFLGVIAETPYRFAPTPARNVLRLRGLPHRFTLAQAFALLRLILGRGLAFDRVEHTRDLPPLLVLHGTDDEVCPLEDGKLLAQRAGGRVFPVPGGRHNNLWTEPAFADACAQAMGRFFAEIAPPRREASPKAPVPYDPP